MFKSLNIEWFQKVVYPTVYPKNEFSAKFTEINDPENQLKLNTPVIKFLLLIDTLSESQLKELQKEITSVSDEIYTVRSQKAVLDVMPKGSDKGTAIEWFSKNYLNNEKIYDYSLMFGDLCKWYSCIWKSCIFMRIKIKLIRGWKCLQIMLFHHQQITE
nr:HAD hydrolase family protein [Mycoplasmopsis bovis]